MTRNIPYVSDELMDEVEKIFAHGAQRAKSHDQRFGQWISNKICMKYNCSRQEAGHILFNLENPEIYEMIRDYND
jgi:hypothetical protein